MQQENLSILRALKQKIREINAPLESAQRELYGENSEKIRSGYYMIMAELTMALLVLTGTDSDVTDLELQLLNEMRHSVYGDEIQELTSCDYIELCREFLRLYPNRLITMDHLPMSIRLLRSYDRAHGTEYTNRARALFVRFAEAMIRANKDDHRYERAVWAYFQAILNAEGDHES